MLPLIGAYQAANALVAAGLVLATGGEPAQVFDALGRLQPVRGRLERAAITAAGAPVYVDYAHTPDALEAAIAALRPHVDGPADRRVRRRRRPRPGQARARWARSPRRMPTLVDRHRRQPARRGSRRRSACRCSPARRARARSATGARRSRAAIAEAGAGDIVLIAGKGHEQGQIVGAGRRCACCRSTT